MQNICDDVQVKYKNRGRIGQQCSLFSVDDLSLMRNSYARRDDAAQ